MTRHRILIHPKCRVWMKMLRVSAPRVIKEFHLFCDGINISVLCLSSVLLLWQLFFFVLLFFFFLCVCVCVCSLGFQARKIWKCMCTSLIREDIQWHKEIESTGNYNDRFSSEWEWMVWWMYCVLPQKPPKKHSAWMRFHSTNDMVLRFIRRKWQATQRGALCSCSITHTQYTSLALCVLLATNFNPKSSTEQQQKS